MAKKITKNINSQYNPTYFNPYQYGFGSWLGKNAGMIGTVAGGIGGAFLGNPMLGAKIGGGIGGAIQGGQEQQTEQTEMLRQQQLEALKKDRIANLPSTFNYQPTFAKGGKIPKSEIIKGTKEEMEHTSSKRVSRKTAMDHLKEDPKYYTKLKKAGLADAYSGGGKIADNYKNAWSQFYDLQPEYTKALSKKYPNIPINDILKNSVADTTFRNTKVGDYANDLISQYGDFHLDNTEMDSIANANGTDIRDLERVLSKYDHKYNDRYVRTKGNKETQDMDYKFGPRMMLHRRYNAGNVPYKYLATYASGGLLSTGLVNRDNTSEFKGGGTHEANPLGGIPIGQNALVEDGEVKFDIEGGDSYIFSNRIPYKKKNNG